jgi:hypothetical protein
MTDINSLVGSISTFVALLSGISIGTERIVEIIKGAVPKLANAWPQHDKTRQGILQLLAAIIGGIIAAQMPSQVKNALPASLTGQVNWMAYALIGLFASAGSGAWNHGLDILRALKVKQEASTPAPPQPASAAKAGA